MRNRPILLAVIIAALSQSTIVRADSMDNPVYTAWAQFKPGTTIVLQTARTDGKPGEQAVVTSKLKDVSDDHCTIATSASVGGRSMAMPDQAVARVLTNPAEIEKYKAVEKTATDESITTPAGTFKCKKVEQATKGGGQVTIWLSSDVPGEMVRMTLVSQGAGTTTVDLQSIDKK